jgi:hypothetical protein
MSTNSYSGSDLLEETRQHNSSKGSLLFSFDEVVTNTCFFQAQLPERVESTT